jgi:hypothetical protein
MDCGKQTSARGPYESGLPKPDGVSAGNTFRAATYGADGS